MRYQSYIDKYIKSFDGKTVVITGANAGIGFTLAMQLLSKGAHIVMACRSMERAGNAKVKLLEQFPEGKIDILQYDQSSLESVKEFAANLQKQYPSIYGFVFNAGIYHPKPNSISVDNVPLTLATNYLGAYYLSKLLMDYFKNSTERVIVVSSVAARFGKFKKVEKEFSLHKEGTHSYAVSKRCDSALAVYLSDEIGDSSKVILTHPGITRTNILSSKTNSFAHWFTKAGNAFMTIFTNKAEKSSLTTLRALSDDDVSNLDLYCPRAPFHLTGYPVKKKIAPNKYRSESLYQYSNRLISLKS